MGGDRHPAGRDVWSRAAGGGRDRADAAGERRVDRLVGPRELPADRGAGA